MGRDERGDAPQRQRRASLAGGRVLVQRQRAAELDRPAGGQSRGLVRSHDPQFELGVRVKHGGAVDGQRRGRALRAVADLDPSADGRQGSDGRIGERIQRRAVELDRLPVGAVEAAPVERVHDRAAELDRVDLDVAEYLHLRLAQAEDVARPALDRQRAVPCDRTEVVETVDRPGLVRGQHDRQLELATERVRARRRHGQPAGAQLHRVAADQVRLVLVDRDRVDAQARNVVVGVVTRVGPASTRCTPATARRT